MRTGRQEVELGGWERAVHCRRLVDGDVIVWIDCDACPGFFMKCSICARSTSELFVMCHIDDIRMYMHRTLQHLVQRVDSVRCHGDGSGCCARICMIGHVS